MSTILVTGAAGFLATQIVRERARNHPHEHMILLDHKAQDVSNHDHRTVVAGDIRDGALISTLIRAHDITRIIHCAALDAAACQTLDTADIMDSNVNGTLMLLEAAKLNWAKQYFRNVHFHYVSCADALSPNDQAMITDNSNGAPDTLYAASKLNAENLVLSFAHRYHLQASISRPTSLYGPEQSPGHLVAATIIAILEGRKIPVYGAGSQLLNLLHVTDAAHGINLSLDSATISGRFGLAGDAITMRDLIGLICRSVDQYAARNHGFISTFRHSPAASNLPSSTLITFVQDRRQDTRPRHIAFNSAASHFGFRASEKIQDGIMKSVIWYIENAKWWRTKLQAPHQNNIELALAG
jgi:dTDP-glucose 4,6-dehydratase